MNCYHDQKDTALRDNAYIWKDYNDEYSLSETRETDHMDSWYLQLEYENGPEIIFRKLLSEKKDQALKDTHLGAIQALMNAPQADFKRCVAKIGILAFAAVVYVTKDCGLFERWQMSEPNGEERSAFGQELINVHFQYRSASTRHPEAFQNLVKMSNILQHIANPKRKCIANSHKIIGPWPSHISENKKSKRYQLTSQSDQKTVRGIASAAFCLTDLDERLLVGVLYTNKRDCRNI